MDKNEASAAAYFRGIISEYENISAHDKRGPHVAAAFLEMARLYKAGVPEANIVANPAQAFSFIHHAASYFGDPIAQFELAKLLMSGEGVTKKHTGGGAVAPQREPEGIRAGSGSAGRSPLARRRWREARGG